MKTVLLDGALILQGLTDEGDSHQHFVELWKALQSSTLQGYVTQLDLVKLHQRLDDEIGVEASERLLAAFGRILKIWSGDRSHLLDAIITEDPQQFEGWDVPTLSVTEFLTRYELDALLKQTSAISLPPTEITESSESPHPRINKIGTLTLLMLPVLLELWMRREHLVGVLALVNRQSEEMSTESLKSDGAAQGESINVGQYVPVAASSPATSSARLLLANLPGIDVSVENDIPLDIQLDSESNAVVVRLLVPEQAPESRNEQVAATIRRTDSGEAIAQIISTADGLFIVANPSESGSPSLSSAAAGNSQLIASVQYTAEGYLTARLNAPSNPDSSNGSTDELTPDTLVSVRAVNAYSSDPSTSTQSVGIEVRFDAQPDGDHEVTVGPVINPPPPRFNGSPRESSGNTGVKPGETPFNGGPILEVEDHGSSGIINNGSPDNGSPDNDLPNYVPPVVSPSPNLEQPGGGSNFPSYEFVDNLNAPVVFTVDAFTSINSVMAITTSTETNVLEQYQAATIFIDLSDELLAGGTFASGTLSSDMTDTLSNPFTSDPDALDVFERRPIEEGLLSGTQSSSRANLAASQSVLQHLPNYSEFAPVDWLPASSISGV